MISEYIDSFDEFYKLDLSFSEFYSQHYGDYRHVDCEVGNPFEIFDENGHKIREKRIDRIERENICFVGIKKKVQYVPIGETLVQRKARRKKDFEEYMKTQEKMSADYQDRDKWIEKAILNTASAGFFSSDRTIEDYNKNIWQLTPIK